MIKELKHRTHFQNKSLTKAYPKLKILLDELRGKSLPNTIVDLINEQIDILNRNHNEKALLKQVRKSQYHIIRNLEKELKIVPKGYYKGIWIGIGMSLGISFGAVFGTTIGNIAMMGAGLPIGMAIGIAIGTQKDNEAAKNGKQLNFQQ